MFDSMFPSHWTTLRKLMWLKLKGASAVWETITGNPVSFTAKAAPLHQLSVAFSPVQSGTGDPSPDNVRPISGWDSLNVEQRGKNLFDKDNLVAFDSAFVDATTKEIVSWGGNKGFVLPCVGGQTYTVSLASKNNSVDLTIASFTSVPAVGAEATAVGRTTGSVEEKTTTVTTGADDKYLFVKYNNTSVTQTYSNDEVLAGTMVVFGSSAPSEYVPYNPLSRSISISLGQTVYSGTVDVVTGVGEIDWVSVDMGELGWRYITNDGDPYFRAEPNNRKTGYNNLLCSSLKVMKYSGTTRLENAAIVGSTSGRYVFARWFDYTDAESFKTAVTGQTLVYELAEPFTIQLTPQEVNSLAGDNVLFSDANGDLTVEYRSN